MLKFKALFLGLLAVLAAGFALGGEAIPNWPAPATWSPAKSSGAHTMSDIGGPEPFIPVTPCRVADTRGNGFTGAYGPPSLAANANRTFAIGGQCGIPASAKAVSFSYLSVEAPTADIYFRGTAQLFNGYAKIDVPDHFRLTARADSYMTTVTPVGSRITLAIESEGPDGIEVRGSGNIAFHYVVYAERDALRDHQPVEENSLYRPEVLAKSGLLVRLPAAMRADLIKNGTLNADGTYNQNTAARLGWTLPQPETAAEPVRMTK